MGSDFVRSEAVDRPVRHHRGVAIALCLFVAALFTAGGFASAKIWDGYGTRHLALDMAMQAAGDPETRKDLRENGVSAVYTFASTATGGLLSLRHDPFVGVYARSYLSQLRKLLPEPKSTGAAIQAARDEQLPRTDRKESLRVVQGAAWRAVAALRDAAHDPELSEVAVGYLSRLEKAIQKELAERR